MRTYIYFEMDFLGTVMRNIKINNPDGSVTIIMLSWRCTGFRNFVDEVKAGLACVVDESGAPMDADALIASVPK